MALVCMQVGGAWNRVDRLRVGVPREKKMLKGHLNRVIYHQVYWHTKMIDSGLDTYPESYITQYTSIRR